MSMEKSWKKLALGEVGEIVSGGTPDTEKLSYWDGNIAWITPTEITKLQGRYIYDTERKITEAGLKNSSATLLPVNSVVVCTRATVGQCAINKIPMCTNQGFKSIILKPEFDADYLYFVISENKHEFIRLASGSTFLEVSKGDFSNLSFNFPPLPEQRKIAAILRTWDEGAEKADKVAATYRAQKRGLMQQLLSGQVRVKGEE
jgi:type I restriction enzyme S subunit